MSRHPRAMKGLRNHWLDRGVVYGLKMTLCTTKKMYIKQHRALDKKQPAPRWVNKGAHATLHSYTMGDGNPCVVVCIDPRGYSGIEVAALLAHEAVHVKQRMMRCIGERKPSDEFEAYTVQNITQNLLEEFARQCPVRATLRQRRGR